MSQNNRLKYYISFEADTKKAKSQIDEMMRSLEHLNSPQKLANDLPLNKELMKAHNNVAKLQGLLNDAVNVDTGRLDLSRLNRSLQEGGVSLQTFRKSFNELGQEGVTAFTKIVQAVQSGEIPLRRQNALFDKMAETMRNTVRWQISATALQAFTSSIRNAYQYAEDLNRSLNDIRIVTGQSVEQMDAFAEKANKSARELRTTTKAYTDAALIFYQQGLDDNEVLERTNAVMKMANVTGETASDVSSYMTAIWNNFDDGSKSLEYYGDVITKLGAVTAASSEEIAGGLEKFAAIGDTVGLSYEYAASALATIVDQTRQSEDVVGTSLRTIFARLSSLSLGETLEDGVDLTKYTEALDKVGVKVLDQNGQLKEMDTILDELGAKWGDLDSAQKSALATTVAGVRQYSQLIALMDNYDLFKVNVELALDSEGTLTEQSEIFEESWLGAKRRVTAALEGIYDTLLDDKIFIHLTNGFASVLEMLDWIIDRAGGLPAAISLGAILIQRVFGKTIADLFRDLQFQVDGFTGKTKREAVALIKNISGELSKLTGEAAGRQMAYNDALIQTADLLSEILLTVENLTTAQKEQIKAQMTLVQNLGKTTIVTQDAEDARRAVRGAAYTKAVKKGADGMRLRNFKAPEKYDDIVGKGKFFETDSQFKEYLKQKRNSPYANELGINLDGRLSNKDYKDSFKKSVEDNLSNPAMLGLLAKKQQNFAGSPDALIDFFAASGKVKKAEEDSQAANDAVKNYQGSFGELSVLGFQDQEKQKRIAQTEQELKEANEELQFASMQYAKSVKENFIGATEQAFTGTFQFVSGLSAVSAAFKTLGDDSLSVGQKVGNFLTSFTLGAPQMIKGVQNIAEAGKTMSTIFTDPAMMEALSKAFPKSIGKISEGATSLLGLLTKFSPVILAIIAAGITLAAVLDKIEKASPEYALKQAEESAKKAASAASEANKEFLELKNTIDGFTDQYNAIEDMVIGTEEWAAAVSEVNNNLQEVIDKYGLVANTDYIYKNGVIVLTGEGEKKVLGAAQEEVDKTEFASKSASIREQDLRNQFADDNFNKLLNDVALGERQEKIKNILSEKNPNQLTFDEFLKSLETEKAWLSPEDAKSIYDAWFKKETEKSEFNKTLYASNFATITPENIRKEGLETEWNTAASELYKEYIDDIVLNTTGSLIGQEGIEYAGYGKKTANGEDALYKIIGADGNPIYLTYEEARNYVAQQKRISEEQFALENKDEIKNKAKADKANHMHTLDGLVENDWSDEMSKTEKDKSKSGLEDSEVDTYKKHLDDFTKLTEKTSQFGEETEKAEQMLERIAVANMRFNKGLEDIIDNWDEYFTTLTEANKGTDEYAQTMDQLKGSASELLDIEKSAISDDFILENMNLFKEAAHGSIEAIEQLRENAALAELEALDSAVKTTEGFAQLKDWIINFNENFPDLQVGASLETAGFDEALITLLENSNMTAEQMERALNAIGFEPVIEYKEISYADAQNYGGTLYQEVDGEKVVATSWDQGIENTGKLYIPTINAKQTTYTGSPKNTINATNKTKGAKNASSRKQDLKKADDEIERYHLIKETIEDLNKELDRLGKQKDRAWGQAHIDLIDQEIAKTKEAISAQEEYLRQIGANLEGDKAKIAGFGAQFDEDGRITNYEQMMQDQINKYNAAIQSGNETRIETAKEQYEEFKKALSQYEETADLMEDEYQKLLDMQNEIYDKLLEQIEYKIEIDVKLSEDADKFFDFMLGLIEDQAYSAAEALAYLGKKADEALGRINSYQDGIKSLLEGHGLDGEAYERFLSGDLTMEELRAAGFSADDIGALQEWRNALIDEIESLRALQKTVTESIGKTFDEYMDTMDRLIGKFDHLRNVTNAYNNIVDLVGKKALGISNQMLKDMNDAVLNNSVNTLKSAKEKLEVAQNAQEEISKLAEKQREYLQNAENASTEAERRYWKGLANDIGEEMEHIEDSAEEAEEQFLQSWEAALEDARSIFEDNVQMAMESFEDAISGIYGSIDAMREAYDQNKTLRDQYLEEYERIYELNKLNRDITNSMDDIDSIAAKQELKKLQEEINELQRSGAQISEYDMKMLRMKYELRLAEIALEDAQNAKSQVRMSRDNDGNWSYVYTADEATVADAQQSYEDKMYEMQNTSNEYLDQISEQWMQATAEMERAYQKIYEDRTLSDEERAAAINRLYDYYTSRFNFFNDQIGNALENNKTLYESDWQDWAAKNNIQIQSNNSFQTSFDDTILGITTGLTDVRQFHQELNNAMGKPGGGGLIGDLDQAYTDWQKNVSDIMEAAGTSVEGFAGKYKKKTEDVREESDKTAQSVSDLADDADQAFSDIVQYVSDWYDEYAGAIGDAIQQNVNMIQSIDDLIAKLRQLKAEQGQSSGGSGGGGGGSTPSDDGGGNNTTPTTTGKTKTVYYYNGQAYDTREAAEAAAARFVESQMAQGFIVGNFKAFLNQEKAGIVEKIVKLDTGGYTGQWGQSGKLAMLHEKELVLNKDDTENLLATVDMVRKIMELTDLKASISGLGIGALSANALGGTNSTIEQEITIYADFPNATDYDEIKAAFHDLMNRASQYAHRSGGVYQGISESLY